MRPFFTGWLSRAGDGWFLPCKLSPLALGAILLAVGCAGTDATPADGPAQASKVDERQAATPQKPPIVVKKTPG